MIPPAVSESHRGKYLAFTDDGTSLDGHPDFPTGIAYLKKLGVTAVQLMPIYDFGSVDEETCDRYNWGVRSGQLQRAGRLIFH